MVIGIQTAKAGGLYDLNLDGIVNMKNIGCVVTNFGSHLGDPQWDSMSDLDLNNRGNMWDIALNAKQYGQMVEPRPHSYFVVPEYPIGPILGLVGCFAALGIFSLIKPSKCNWHFSKR
jgi:hypothetical protein